MCVDTPSIPVSISMIIRLYVNISINVYICVKVNWLPLENDHPRSQIPVGPTNHHAGPTSKRRSNAFSQKTTVKPTWRPTPGNRYPTHLRLEVKKGAIGRHVSLATWSHIKVRSIGYFTLPTIYCWCDKPLALSHDKAALRWALLWREESSSNSWKTPDASATRSNEGSIGFVNGSASWRLVGIHLKWQCSWHLSLMRRTSSVVRYSSHEGIAVRETRSKRLLQSVTTVALGNCWNPLGGSLQLKSFRFKDPHSKRSQPNLSTLRDMENASADNVDRTTRAIFFEDQVRGLIGACSFLFKWKSVAQMRVPWNESNCFGLAKDASPKLTWVTSLTGMWRKQIFTALSNWASRSTLLANMRVATVARPTWVWTSPSFAAMSGRVFVTAYCKLPIRPRNFESSISEMRASGWFRRLLPMSMAGILWTYSAWEQETLKSGCCSNWIPVNTKRLCLKDPKGRDTFKHSKLLMKEFISTANAVINVNPNNSMKYPLIFLSGL